MTAEIALLNKTAVVLAADSAVTIGRGGNAKIFNTVNKIFEISDACPVGLMIFNRLDFMDLPIEVLAKEYRSKNGHKCFDTVREYAEDFCDYLSNIVNYDDEDKKLNHQILIYDALRLISHHFDRAVRLQLIRTKKFLLSKLNGILQETLRLAIDDIDKIEFCDGYNRSTLPDELKKLSNEIAETVFDIPNITNTTKSLVHRYVARFLSKKRLSSHRTGLIFAGFGDKEICPSLLHIEIDGIVLNRLKRIDINIVDIGRRGPPAEILGFAQDDMVQSFVNGVDPVFRSYSSSILRNAIEGSARMILTPIIKDDDKVNGFIEGLKGEFDNLAKDYANKSDKFIEEKFTSDVKSMVRSMPKQELANLAESLIDITSLKRKVTRDRETVGGDVDVAVISRSEGLVWVRRKHYFPADLNARFLARYSSSGRT
ncbi:MAG: hypothetical protein AAGA97_01755 [Pseudomonadota bacterium]